MPTSKALIMLYRGMAYWHNGLQRAAACYRASEAGLEYTEDERRKLREAGDHLQKAKELVTEIYSRRIGEAMTYEIRAGELK